jgi:predicted RNase H-like HicB family nuclease
MKTYVFKIVIEQDQFEDGRPAWHASCPALKGCHTWGHSYEEALANAREAVELYVQDLTEAGEKIPVDAQQGTVELPVPAVAVSV